MIITLTGLNEEMIVLDEAELVYARRREDEDSTKVVLKGNVDLWVKETLEQVRGMVRGETLAHSHDGRCGFFRREAFQYATRFMNDEYPTLKSRVVLKDTRSLLMKQPIEWVRDWLEGKTEEVPTDG